VQSAHKQYHHSVSDCPHSFVPKFSLLCLNNFALLNPKELLCVIFITRMVSILLYNKLPERINSLHTFKTFKKELKSILLQNTFYTVEEYSQIVCGNKMPTRCNR
jgi:hypothetical protein